MKRIVLAGAIACFGAFGAQAASPKVDAAVKTFKGVGADAGKVKTFCDMIKAMDAMGDQEDAAADAKIAGFMKQLGPEFETAWDSAEGLDDESDDGKAYYAAIDELTGKCP